MRALDREILRLALPALGALAIEPAYLLVDTAVVGHLGVTALAALSLAASVLLTVAGLCAVLAYATTARVAFLRGRSGDGAAAVVGVQALWLCAALGVVLAAAMVLGARAIPAGLGGEGAVLDGAATYLRVSAIGLPGLLVIVVGTGYLRGMADGITPLRIAAFSTVVNAALSLMFVYGFDLGVAGSAWGTSCAQVAGAAWMVVEMRRRLVRSVSPRIDRAELSGLLVTSRRLVLRSLSLLAALTLATSVAARLGPAVLAGHQIAVQLQIFLALALDGLAIAGQTLVASALGRGSADEARAVSRRLLTLGARCGFVLGAVVVAAAALLPRLFSSDPDVVAATHTALVVVGLIQLPAALVYVLDGVLIGAGDAQYLQWAMVVSLVVFVPCALLVRVHPSYGIGGLWVAIGVWILARLATTGLRFRGESWART